MTKLDQLLRYAEYGWRLIPCHHLRDINDRSSCSCGQREATSDHKPGKHPRIKWQYPEPGQPGASKDPAQIEAWHRQWPDANWAVLLENEFVIDADGPTGRETFDRVYSDDPEMLPPTLVQRTISDGRQAFYRQAQSVDLLPVRTVPQGRLRGLPGLEVKGRRKDGKPGSYVLVPPSQGREWITDHPIAEPSEALLNAIYRAVKSSASGTGSGSGDEGEAFDWDRVLHSEIPKGERNPTLHAAASSLRARGVSDSLAVPLLRRVVANFDNSDGEFPEDAADRMWERVKVEYPDGRAQVDDWMLRVAGGATTGAASADTATEPASDTAEATSRDTSTETNSAFIDAAEVQEYRRDDYLVKRRVYMPGVALLHAEPGCGKSFASLDLAFHVGLGLESWCGCRIRRQVRVLYIYSEGASRLWKRRDAWLKQHGRSAEDLRGKVTFVPFAVPLNGSKASTDKLVEIVKSGGYGLVIFDTWATSTVGSDENTTKDMGKALANAGRIRDECGAAVWIVHHDNRSGRFRGSSAIDGYVDTRMHMRRTGDRTNRMLTVALEKQRDDEDGIKWHACLRLHVLGYDEDGDPITSVVFTHVPDEDAAAAEKPKAYDMKAVAQSIWKFLQDTSDDDDQVAWSKSDVIRKAHSSLVGTQRQRKEAVERMIKAGVIREVERSKLDADNRPRRYGRLMPVVGADGRFLSVLSEMSEHGP